MQRGKSIFPIPAMTLVLGLGMLSATVNGQSHGVTGLNLQGLETDVAARETSLLGAKPMISIQRHVQPRNLPGLYADETVDLNLGLEISPLSGLSVRADAWRLDVDSNQPGESTLPSGLWQPSLSVPDASSSAAEIGVDNAFPTASLELNGVDLGASYVWATEKTGQFTLSTKATYVRNFSQQSNLLEVSTTGGEFPDLAASPDLQGNLSLTWQYGNHTASAVTNYFDSVKDIGELDIETINELVDDIVTFDLQYGYSVKTGKEERATFSFGVRNIFDNKTTQILNNNNRVIDQNGRVAYGSIKYQF